ncbi:hypothetical protein E2C01_043018 [Portunus trituberculatus]|uniref:Uncharacterized protein n=1 Tax=Portunus trituberculatus TaxID=210409 RepID=A0A5B7FRT1_PORTR|nr:hypothetical protein [Portunus trituberculatus]
MELEWKGGASGGNSKAGEQRLVQERKAKGGWLPAGRAGEQEGRALCPRRRGEKQRDDALRGVGHREATVSGYHVVASTTVLEGTSHTTATKICTNKFCFERTTIYRRSHSVVARRGSYDAVLWELSGKEMAACIGIPPRVTARRFPALESMGTKT